MAVRSTNKELRIHGEECVLPSSGSGTHPYFSPLRAAHIDCVGHFGYSGLSEIFTSRVWVSLDLCFKKISLLRRL